MKRLLVIAALLPALSACDALKDRMGLPDPAKVEAEGKALGAGCRHAGQGLEDCYRLNPEADKSAIFAGWKEMNEYMLKNNMQSMPPQIPVAGHGEAVKEPPKEGADKKAEVKPDTKPDTKTEVKPEAKAEGHDKPAGGH